MLSPSDLQTSVVDHEALKIAQSIKGCGRCRVNKCYKTYMLVWDIANVVQKSASYNVADLFDCRFGMDVAEIYSPVPKIIDSTSRCCHRSCRNGLLCECIRYQVSIRSVKNVCITGSDAEILSCVLLLSLRNVCATVFSIVDPAWRLPLSILWELSNSLDRVSDRQKMNETDCFFPYELNGVYRSKFSKVLPKLGFRDVFREVAEIYVPRCSRLLHSERDGSRDLRGLSPAYFDILTTNR